jgi:hypothetical protein
MTEIQLDLLLSYLGTSVVIKLPKYNLLIKWDKMVSEVINWNQSKTNKLF